MRIDRLPDTLVLGAGGALGIAWLRGVLGGIEEAHGLDFRQCEYFQGTSAGSVIAAALAAGARPYDAPPPDVPDVTAAKPEGADAGRMGRLVAATTTGVSALATAATAPLAPLALGATAPAGRAARAMLLRTVPRTGRRLDDLAAFVRGLDARFDGRLRIAAVDRRAGARVLFGAPGAPAATVEQAVLASCAIPWVFDPVRIDGREYLDGGMWSPTNLDAAPARRATEVLCLMPTASRQSPGSPLAALRAITRASALAEAQVLRARGARIRLLTPDAASARAMGTDLLDTRRRRGVEAAGYAQGLRL